jgi:hypothetical protein
MTQRRPHSLAYFPRRGIRAADQDEAGQPWADVDLAVHRKRIEPPQRSRPHATQHLFTGEGGWPRERSEN